MRTFLLFILLASLLLVPVALAQEPPALTSNPPPTTETAAVDTGEPTSRQAYVTYKTPYEFFLCILTLALAVIMAGILCAISWRSGLTEDFIRTFIVIVVVFAALFLIVAGYSEKQTAPVFGLLGTVVGYVFGRMSLVPTSAVPRGPERPPVEIARAGEASPLGGSAPVRTDHPF